jgi:UDP-N-acetylglucosamine 2-epimerase (non-hydrolysing)
MGRFKILSVFGTRPEAIKMAPVLNVLKKTAGIDSQVCISSQHKEMLKQVLELFDIKSKFDLNVMQKNQNLSSLSAKILERLSVVLEQYVPDLLLVHGDTSTAFMAGLTAFYYKIPVAHVEAGLRTGNMLSPWPEEANRKLLGSFASLHFAPTEIARSNLLNEGVDAKSIYVTGNTVIDTLEYAVRYIENQPEITQLFMERFAFIHPDRRFKAPLSKISPVSGSR